MRNQIKAWAAVHDGERHMMAGRAGRRSASMAARGAASVRLDTQREVEQLLYRQAECLDAKQWQDWIDLFTADGIYWMPAAPSRPPGRRAVDLLRRQRPDGDAHEAASPHPHAWSQKPRGDQPRRLAMSTIEKRTQERRSRRALALPHDGVAARRDPPFRRLATCTTSKKTKERLSHQAAARRHGQRAGAVRLRAADLGLMRSSDHDQGLQGYEGTHGIHAVLDSPRFGGYLGMTDEGRSS